jgi:hypothetical protein
MSTTATPLTPITPRKEGDDDIMTIISEDEQLIYRRNAEYLTLEGLDVYITRMREVDWKECIIYYSKFNHYNDQVNRIIREKITDQFATKDLIESN